MKKSKRLTKQDEIEMIINQMKEEGRSLSWLHGEGLSLSNKIMKEYPNTWKSEVKKLINYSAVIQLIAIKRADK